MSTDRELTTEQSDLIARVKNMSYADELQESYFVLEQSSLRGQYILKIAKPITVSVIAGQWYITATCTFEDLLSITYTKHANKIQNLANLMESSETIPKEFKFDTQHTYEAGELHGNPSCIAYGPLSKNWMLYDIFWHQFAKNKPAPKSIQKF